MTIDNAHRITVAETEQGQRLDNFLSGHLPHMSREKIKKAVQAGQCTVDGQPATVPKSRVMCGQSVCLTQPEVQGPSVQAEEGVIDCLWHDAHLALLNKPAGITVHPCPSCPEGTLVHRLVGHFPQLHEQEGVRPGIVHRLDKDTSGLMLIALTEEARLHMTEAFSQREVHKEYLALVHGVIPEVGDVDAPMARHPTVKVKMAVVEEEAGGRPALSSWQRLYADPAGRFSLVRVRIFTGRTHQIRVHMAHVGFPLWGDSLYGPRTASGSYSPTRQMLHAWKLEFTHPVSGEEMAFCCPPPADMWDCFTQLSWRMQRVVVTGLPGSGKSALTNALGQQGIPTWSADTVLAKAYEPQGDAWHFVRQRYGDLFIAQDTSPVNKVALREAMQENLAIKREVEAHTHALARHSLEAFWQHCEAQGCPVAVAEVPLYFEANWQELAVAVPPASPSKKGDNKESVALSSRHGMDKPVVIGVDCPPDHRLQRVQAARGWDASVLQTMDSWQWAAERKLAACQQVVDNSGSLRALEDAAVALAAELTQMREGYVQHCRSLAGVE